MPNMSKQYQLILGTFIDNEFVWHDVDSYDTLEDAYKNFKKYVTDQLKYTDEELVKVWNTGRLDVELRRGNRLLNWVGIYAREVDKLSEENEKKADKDNPEKTEKDDAKKSTKDSIPLDISPEYQGELKAVFSDGRVIQYPVSVKDYGEHDDPVKLLFDLARNKALSVLHWWPDTKIYGYFVMDDGDPIENGYYVYNRKLRSWEPIDEFPTEVKDAGPYNGVLSWKNQEPADKPKLLYLTVNEKSTGRPLFTTKVYLATNDGNAKALNEVNKWLMKNPTQFARRRNGELVFKAHQAIEHSTNFQDPMFFGAKGTVEEKSNVPGTYKVEYFDRTGKSFGPIINITDDKYDDDGLLQLALNKAKRLGGQQNIHYIRFEHRYPDKVDGTVVDFYVLADDGWHMAPSEKAAQNMYF